MQVRASGLKLFSAILAGGVLMASAASTPVLAQPDRCRAEAWATCDPYWPRSDPEWQACVANYIENCYIPEPQCPGGPCQTAGPKVDVSALKKMLKSIA
uniref:hypothetical protein n=1 Tax=uncultured Caulobacter sp. TaxID=158749 RepID=UPI0025DB5C13|nr:hypothetical protein [uncultured Caulobacter sp.]